MLNEMSSGRWGEVEYVKKITSSHLLRDSEGLQRLLQFLAQEALRRPSIPLREQEIAAKVYGLTEEFDPRLDSKVRVQMKRLRERLAKYYEETGSEDSIVLQLPPGTYHLCFLYRDHEAEPEAQAIVSAKRPLAVDWRVWAAATAALAIALSAVLLGQRSGSEIDPVLRAFWSPFASVGSQPVVIYGNNPLYDSGGTLRGVGEAPEPTPVNDSFTGVGEVPAAIEINNLLRMFKLVPSFRRALNISWEEAKDRNLIFLGAHTAFKELPGPRTFDFVDRTTAPPGEVRNEIVNLRPGPGEPDHLTAGPPPCCRSTTVDHALIAFTPALAPRRYALVMAGVTTLGTEEAVSFLCRPASVRALLSRLPPAGSGRPPYFEAVILVHIGNGAPIGSEIVALHARSELK
jgi:hypothetical protein